jgi:hypothetical protein
VGSHNHRRVSEVSQDRAVTTPLSTGTFESELNDAVGFSFPEYGGPTAFFTKHAQVLSGKVFQSCGCHVRWVAQTHSD